jgi:hypothetical protein
VQALQGLHGPASPCICFFSAPSTTEKDSHMTPRSSRYGLAAAGFLLCLGLAACGGGGGGGGGGLPFLPPGQTPPPTDQPNPPETPAAPVLKCAP